MRKHPTSDKSIVSGIKKKLESAIDSVIAEKDKYVKNPGKDFTRKRKLDLKTMIELILSMQGNSLPKELYEHFKRSDSLVSVSAFVQQRDKIHPNMFAAILNAFNDLCDDSATYEGYHLYAIDGSDINIAYDPEDKATYMPQGHQKGFNQIHLNALYDLMNKTYVDCELQPARLEHEVRAAIMMIQCFDFPCRSILIADRGYEAANLYEHINRIPNLDYLIRVKNAGTKELRRLPLEEFDMMLSYELRTTQTVEDKAAFAVGKAKFIARSTGKKGSWDFESPFRITQRVVRFEISPGHYETIVTSVPKSSLSLEEIKYIYHLRWGIETSFRELKYAIGMANFHAKKVPYIYQEILAAIIMYNFCERITMAVVIHQSATRKHDYQVNFTMAIHICRDYFSCGVHSPPEVVALIRRYILPVRDGRMAERKIIAKKPAVCFVYRVAA